MRQPSGARGPGSVRRHDAPAPAARRRHWNAWSSRFPSRSLSTARPHLPVFLRDVSELEWSTAVLVEERVVGMRLLSQLAPVGIMQTDLDGLTTFVNDRWCELTGMTTQEAVGASWSAGFHPSDISRLDAEWAREAARDGELRTDCRLRPAGGGLIWVSLAVVPVKDGDGTSVGFLAAVTNVSDRKRAEAEREELLSAERAARRDLADQTERLNGLITAAIPGILVDNEYGLITQVNQSFCDMFGIAGGPGQLIGTTAARAAIRIRRLFADPDEFLRRAAGLLAGRRPVAEQEILAADGRTIECDFAPVFVDGGYRGNMWGVADVTHRQVLKEERQRLLEAELAAREAAEHSQFRLSEQNSELKDLNEARLRYLATVSHELRSPLTSVVSFAELIRVEKQPHPGHRQCLDIIQRNAERLLRWWVTCWTAQQPGGGRRPPGPRSPSRCRRSPSSPSAPAGASPRSTGSGCDISAQEGPPRSGRTRRGSSRSWTTSSRTRSSSPAPAAGSRSGPPTTTGNGGSTLPTAGMGIPAGRGRPAVRPVLPGFQRAPCRGARLRARAADGQGHHRAARRPDRGARARSGTGPRSPSTCRSGHDRAGPRH